jgi:2-dehydro-3-deoxygluconokinase
MGMRNMVASNHHTLTALLWTDGELLQAPIINIPDVVDPVGVGDAFMAGLIHAFHANPENKQLQLEYALAAAALKNTVPGDFNLSSDEEIMDVVEMRYKEKSLYKKTI